MKEYYKDSLVTIYLGDCAEVMLLLGMKFDLLLTDPPYGIGESGKKNASRVKMALPSDYGDYQWDDAPVDASVMDMARGLCRKQIIFGGNYYALPPCKGPLVWDKENTGDFADGEMAWNNLGCALRIKRHRWNGMLRKGNEARVHPTQKPLDVILWAMNLAGDEVKSVLDPWAGSGTTGLAAKSLGKTAVLIEREERYCESAARRLSQEVLDLGGK